MPACVCRDHRVSTGSDVRFCALMSELPCEIPRLVSRVAGRCFLRGQLRELGDERRRDVFSVR